MNLNDLIGFLGVAILLLAFFLNLNGKLDQHHPTYIYLNILGAGIALLASILIHYVPFIILESCWTIVSIWGLFKRTKKNTPD